MMQAVKKGACAETRLETGIVDRILNDTIEVRGGAGACQARRAKSCLVAPEIGDAVLCAMAQDGAFVLAVLRGAEGAPTKLDVQGDLQIGAREGSIVISSTEGVDLVSGGTVSMTSRDVQVRARSGSVAIDDLGFFGKIVQSHVEKVALIAEEIDSTVTRLSQRAKRVFRFIEEIDQTRAGTVDVRAQNLLALRGENAIIAARTLAKIDGEQIHLG